MILLHEVANAGRIHEGFRLLNGLHKRSLKGMLTCWHLQRLH
jgi:hypothetical protein